MRAVAAHLGTILAVVAMSTPPAQRQATASLRVPAGCAPKTVRAVVTGRQVERVTFFVDSRRHGSLTQPNAGRSWVATIPARRLTVGAHAVAARVVFTRGSGTR